MTDNGNRPAHPFDADSPNLNRQALDDEKLLSGMYWRELRTFLAIAKAKSLTQAAENLHTSHMTVGRELRRLQDRMGAQLAIISKAGVTLTDRGQRLAKTLLRFDQDLFAIANDLRSETKLAEGVVRVSITDGLGLTFIVPELPEFNKKFPKLQVHLKSPGNLLSLRQNQTDLMIGFAREVDQDLVSIPLGWLHFLPIASQGYVDRYGLPKQQNIGEHCFIDSEIYSSRNSVWNPWRDLVSRGRVVGYADASITYAMMIKMGLGIGLLANYTTSVADAIPLELACCISIQLYMVAIKERMEAKPVHAVAQLLLDLFSENNPWLSKSVNLACPEPRFNAGLRALFNITR